MNDYENAKSFIRPFDLSISPLIRVGFIKNEILLINMHHIISDGTSVSIIKKEINNYYYNNKIEDIEIQFNDFAYLNKNKNEKTYSDQIKLYKSIFSPLRSDTRRSNLTPTRRRLVELKTE